MDREIEPSVIRKRQVRRAVAGTGAIVTILAAFWILIGWVRPSVSRDDLRTARVERGSIEATISASGSVVPAFEQIISSPIDARVLQILRRPGAQLKAGEPLLALDLTQVRMTVDQFDEQIAQKTNNLVKLRAELEGSVSALESRIEQMRLDLEILHQRTEQNRKLRSEGLVSEEKMRETTVAERKAEIELAQLQSSLTRERHNGSLELETAELDRSMFERNRAEAARQLELATTRADRPGVLTWITPTEGATVQRGDVIARIADLSTFRVQGSVSDVHAASIASELRVMVKADAATYRGHIASVDPAAADGMIHFLVEFDQAHTPSLRSQQRVDIAVVTAQKADALKLRKGSYDGGETTSLFVLEDGRAVRREVRLGMSGVDSWEVVEGLTAGEEVILSNMKRYADLKEVRVK